MADGAPRLRGRRSECETLDRLLDGVRAGQSRVLVLRGEAGVGKTALLEHLLAQAAGCRIARAAGVESEMELPFAGLHQLCAPLLDRLARLPDPQSDALRTAFGLSTGEPPDRFLVGLAVLSLLAEVAEERPLVCVSTTRSGSIGSRRRRSRSSRGACWPSGSRWCSRCASPATASSSRGCRSSRSAGLVDGDARALLDSVIVGPVDERVRDRIIAETRGNPLALLELPRGLTPAELAGGFGLPDVAAAGQPHRTRLPAAARAAPGRHAAAAAHRGGRPGRRRDVAVARARAARDRRGRRGSGRGGRADRAGSAGAVPPSARALDGVSRGQRARPAGGAPRAGRGDRSGGRSRAAGVAPGPRGGRARRGRRRRVGGPGRPGPAPGRHRRGGGVPGPRGRADA